TACCSPVSRAVQDDEQLLGKLPRLREGKNLEHLVQRSEPTRKDNERLREVREPELSHEEIVKLEVQPFRDVPVRPLLERQTDVETYRLPTCFAGAAIGGFHDPRTAARAHDETPARRLERQAPGGQLPGEL